MCFCQQYMKLFYFTESAGTQHLKKFRLFRNQFLHLLFNRISSQEVLDCSETACKKLAILSLQTGRGENLAPKPPKTSLRPFNLCLI